MMVDIAYVTKISDDEVIILTDVGIDLRDSSDKEWMLGLIQDALNVCGEPLATMAVVFRNQED
jgi:hypothetical protein